MKEELRVNSLGSASTFIQIYIRKKARFYIRKKACFRFAKDFDDTPASILERILKEEFEVKYKTKKSTSGSEIPKRKGKYYQLVGEVDIVSFGGQTGLSESDISDYNLGPNKKHFKRVSKYLDGSVSIL